jgi:hypothetical protein
MQYAKAENKNQKLLDAHPEDKNQLRKTQEKQRYL